MAPMESPAIAAVIGWQLALSEGDALLLTILAASASCIAVPAAMRLALPSVFPSIISSYAGCCRHETL